MIAWARPRAGKTVRETRGPLKGQGKWGAGRMVGPFNPSYSGLARVSERAGGGPEWRGWSWVHHKGHKEGH